MSTTFVYCVDRTRLQCVSKVLECINLQMELSSPSDQRVNSNQQELHDSACSLHELVVGSVRPLVSSELSQTISQHAGHDNMEYTVVRLESLCKPSKVRGRCLGRNWICSRAEMRSKRANPKRLSHARNGRLFGKSLNDLQ